MRVYAPCALVQETGSSPRDLFERVWSRMPVSDEPRRQQAFVLDDALFYKGAWGRAGLSMRRWWRAARILAEVRALRRMLSRGIPVPEVLLCGAETVLGIPRRAFLVERRIEGVDLGTFLTKERDGKARRAALEAAGRAVGKLHGADVFHRDLSVRNLLVRATPGGSEVLLIDCPRAERGWLQIRRRFLRRKDGFRLVRSLREAGVDVEDLGLVLPSFSPRERRRLRAWADPGSRSRIRRSLVRLLWLWIGF